MTNPAPDSDAITKPNVMVPGGEGSQARNERHQRQADHNARAAPHDLVVLRLHSLAGVRSSRP